MSDTLALRHVLDGYLTDMARRGDLIRSHRSAAAELEDANRIDAVHAEVAAALIEQINADDATVRAPVTEMDAAALVESHILTAGLPRSGKSAGLRLARAALRDAIADIAAVDGKAAARLIHDHHPDAGPCPACLLTGAGKSGA